MSEFYSIIGNEFPFLRPIMLGFPAFIVNLFFVIPINRHH
jgi:hypothetical protein